MRMNKEIISTIIKRQMDTNETIGKIISDVVTEISTGDFAAAYLNEFVTICYQMSGSRIRTERLYRELRFLADNNNAICPDSEGLSASEYMEALDQFQVVPHITADEARLNVSRILLC